MIYKKILKIYFLSMMSLSFAFGMRFGLVPRAEEETEKICAYLF